MYDEAIPTPGGEVIEKEAPAEPKSRAQKLVDWRKANKTAIKEARDACTCCTPSRAQMMLVEQVHHEPQLMLGQGQGVGFHVAAPQVGNAARVGSHAARFG